jgi:hypothetical protein
MNCCSGNSQQSMFGFTWSFAFSFTTKEKFHGQFCRNSSN